MSEPNNFELLKLGGIILTNILLFSTDDHEAFRMQAGTLTHTHTHTRARALVHTLTLSNPNPDPTSNPNPNPNPNPNSAEHGGPGGLKGR